MTEHITEAVDPPGQLFVEEDRAAALREQSRQWPSWSLTPRQLCDLELLTCGAFAPLGGFLDRADYECVCETMRLTGGALWPMPITLDVPESVARTVGTGGMLALRDAEGVMLAALHVEQVWRPDRRAEARGVYGTEDVEHPGVARLLQRTRPVYVGGGVEALEPPRHYDFPDLRATPAEVRAAIVRRGWQRVVAFQTRNPMHRAHLELTVRAAEQLQAGLLIHPVVGPTRPGDVDPHARVRCYRAIERHYPPGAALVRLLPLAMRMAGPREAVWHALIRRTYGCTHFIVGRDHAGPGVRSDGRPFYGPYDAQDLLRQHQAEAGIEMVPFRNMVYLASRDAYVPEDQAPGGADVRSLSGTELRRRLADGSDIPEWFSFPDVVAELRRSVRPRRRRGFTVFFTGLPSSGKSTLANVLVARLRERGGRAVTLLDGDLVRKLLSSELGFSPEHRALNIRRIGWVAAQITRSGGVAVCAPIAPQDAIRREVREGIEPHGGFLLVHVATPAEVCERRDRKGLYAKARAGLIDAFTGVTAPYDEPADAEIVLDTTARSPEQCVDDVLARLERDGYLPAPIPANAPRT